MTREQLTEHAARLLTEDDGLTITCFADLWDLLGVEVQHLAVVTKLNPGYVMACLIDDLMISCDIPFLCDERRHPLLDDE